MARIAYFRLTAIVALVGGSAACLGDPSPEPPRPLKEQATLVGHEDVPQWLVFSPDSKPLASAGRNDETVRLWSMRTFKDIPYVVLRLGDACEFLSKKDYLDNWRSEMHETFCFWSFAQWRAAVEQAGLHVVPGSNAFTNPWIVQNRFEGKVRLSRRAGGTLEPIAWPVTNMLLVAEKR